MSTIIERPDEGFVLQLNKFCKRIDTHSAILGLDPMKVQNVKNDKEVFEAVFMSMVLFRDFAESITKYKNLLRYGHGDELLGEIPMPPSMQLPTPAVPMVAANAQKRFADLVQDCVKSPNYTTSIGEDLAIEAPETPFVPGDGKPEIKPRYSTGGLPGFSWKKGKYQGIEIWTDRGDGKGWVFLDKDFNPNFVDKKSPLPASGQSTVWKYKAIYLYKGEQVGQWSQNISVTVYGNV